MASPPLISWMLSSVIAFSSLQAVAADTPAAAPASSQPAATKTALGDLSGFRAIAVDTLKIVQTGNSGAAKKRIKDLELRWDEFEAKLKPLAPKEWETVDVAIDRALKEVRSWMSTPETSSQALQKLIATIDAIK